MSVKDERETVFRVDGYGVVTGWTNDPHYLALWKRRGWKPYVYSRRGGKEASWAVKDIPSNFLSCRRVCVRRPKGANLDVVKAQSE